MRNILLQTIYARLASLESQREELRICGDKEEDIKYIDIEMKELRLKLQDVMNSICPILNGGKFESK